MFDRRVQRFDLLKKHLVRLKMMDACRRSFRSTVAGEQGQRRTTTNELVETLMTEETMIARLLRSGVMLEEKTHLLGTMEETHHHRTIVQERRVGARPVEDIVIVPHPVSYTHLTLPTILRV